MIDLMDLTDLPLRVRAAPALLALGGLAVGAWVRRRLLAGAHRRGEESARAPRDPSWLPPVLALAWASLTVTAVPAAAPAGALVAYLGASAALVWLVGVDLDVRRLPNAMTVPGLWVGPLVLLICAVGARDPAAAVRVVAGTVAGGALYGGLYVVGRRRAAPGLGLGDVKLAACLGPWLAYAGWSRLAAGLYLGLLLGGLAGAAALIARRAGPRHTLPHGPAMALGAWAALCLPLG